MALVYRIGKGRLVDASHQPRTIQLPVSRTRREESEQNKDDGPYQHERAGYYNGVKDDGPDQSAGCNGKK